MDVLEFAENLICARTLEDKLRPPPRGLEPVVPGSEHGVPDWPVRPPGLEIRRGGDVHVPPPSGWADVAQRRRILHALANHELQAAELFAWALLAFPDAPPALRRGWLRLLADEQRHCRLYCDRLAAHGARFGDFPVNGHFWRKIEDWTTPLRFICAMGMTFENANLDFSHEHVEAARAAGDADSVRALVAVHEDEIRHVRFAWEWLLRLKPADRSAWDAYVENVTPRQGPQRARGARFDRASRVAAGFDESFIDRLEAVAPQRPGGAPRTC